MEVSTRPMHRALSSRLSPSNECMQADGRQQSCQAKRRYLSCCWCPRTAQMSGLEVVVLQVENFNLRIAQAWLSNRFDAAKFIARAMPCRPLSLSGAQRTCCSASVIHIRVLRATLRRERRSPLRQLCSLIISAEQRSTSPRHGPRAATSTQLTHATATTRTARIETHVPATAIAPMSSPSL